MNWWKDWQLREHHSWHGRSYSPHIRLYSFCNWLPPAPNQPFPLKGQPLVVEGYESGSRSCLTDYPVVVLWPRSQLDLFLSHGQLALVQLTGWLLLISEPEPLPPDFFLHGQRVMVHLLSATEARVSNCWKRRF